MFTGIIEDLATIVQVERDGANVHFTLECSLAEELKIDQSLAHDGVCLTVVAITDRTYTVTAIQETLDRSCLAEWKTGRQVNLERAMIAGGRLDGHIVQGHVDGVGKLLSIKEADGSWYFEFSYTSSPEHLLVDKGSICINGVSLTVVEPTDQSFKVAIIPYTYEHTGFHQLRPGDAVNLEFDIIGKYLAKHMSAYGKL